MSFLATRHYEAQPKQSRQKLWVAASCVTIFAMIMTGLLTISVPANAISCAENKTFEQQIDDADVVFKGRLLKTDIVKFFYQTKDSHNFNKPVSYNAITVFEADQAWKGIKKGQRAAAFFGWPAADKKLVEHAINMAPARYKGERIYVLKKIDTTKTTAEPVENPEQFENYYYEPVCGGEYDVTAANLKILQKKFPQGSAQ